MDHGRDLEDLEDHYAAALATHGRSAQAVQWSSQATQERRMEILAEIVRPGDLQHASVLDFGCGTGHLLDWLRTHHDYRGRYTGYDISQAMVDAATADHGQDPTASFERRDVLADGVGGDFDLVLVSGTFNNLVSDNWAFMTALLTRLFAHTRVALGFNCLSTYVEYASEGLAYQQPEDVFRFCKTELSPRVTLRHDYHVKDDVIPFEFTTYVYTSAHAPVPAMGGDR